MSIHNGQARLVAMAAFLFALGACAPTHVQSDFAAAPTGLPQPDTIIVEDFAAPEGSVTLDQGIGARLSRVVSGSSTADAASDARNTSDAVATTLVQRLNAAGLTAIRGSGSAAAANATRLLVSGRFLDIDEGNRTRRNLIGLGSGHSDVTA
jgi:Domain of unknown function (DUF4410)